MKAIVKQEIADQSQQDGAAALLVDRNRSSAASLFLAQLHSLNLEYLRLLVARLYPAALDRRLPDTIAKSLSGLSIAALTSVSQCPYALFDMAFDDADYWQWLISDRLAGTDSHDVVQANLPVRRFAEAALFYFWHAIQSDLTLVRLACGMNVVTARRIRELSITKIASAASLAIHQLHPRWPENPAFWPDIIRFASTTDSVQFQVSKLLGCQLMAATRLAPTPAVRITSALVPPRKREPLQ